MCLLVSICCLALWVLEERTSSYTIDRLSQYVFYPAPPSFPHPLIPWVFLVCSISSTLTMLSFCSVMNGLVPASRGRHQPAPRWTQDIKDTFGMKVHEAEELQEVKCLLGHDENLLRWTCYMVLMILRRNQ